jgi:hypothetical protein
MQPVHDPKRDQTQVIDEDREAIILADELGFEEVWVGEHAAATVEPITAPLVFLATLLGETKNIKLGTGVFVCLIIIQPRWLGSQRSSIICRGGDFRWVLELEVFHQTLSYLKLVEILIGAIWSGNLWNTYSPSGKENHLTNGRGNIGMSKLRIWVDLNLGLDIL